MEKEKVTALGGADITALVAGNGLSGQMATLNKKTIRVGFK